MVHSKVLAPELTNLAHASALRLALEQPGQIERIAFLPNQFQ